VRIHGGPTASARAEYSTSVQFWTSRGFAVVDVNYRGSTGYGRRYRDLLVGQWGVADVEDCVAAVRWLAEQGRVDGERCVIRGGSAGGFTALEATCRSDVFAAACSLYGVTDLRALAADTHKFESRYLDGLVGPYPEQAERYRERSPLFHAELLDRPVLLLQGTEDPIVPPSQAEVLREALHAGGIPHALILFPGEAHGFRSADTIVRALEAELAFYGEVLGFEPADDLPPLRLER
jgi:dipeptidyl aminopeptidase/acylaminoacyl peptidase